MIWNWAGTHRWEIEGLEQLIPRSPALMPQNYDHSVHAGNAGDVWKHFLLAEAADYLLSEKGVLIYAESHAGYPEYLLRVPGEGEDGIVRCWQHIEALQKFPYFDIVAELNPSGLKRYPGSAKVVMDLAKKRSLPLVADLWDIHPAVAAAWRDFPEANFHQGDGFFGARSLLDRSEQGLLLIDPPYVDSKDADMSRDLLAKAESFGWVVLWWYMEGSDTLPEGALPEGCDSLVKLPLTFAEAGMSCERWPGAVVAVAGADDALLGVLWERAQDLLETLHFP